MMKPKIELTLKEAQILDNQLYVAQINLTRRSITKNGLSAEEREYASSLDSLRGRISQFIDKCAVDRHIYE